MAVHSLLLGVVQGATEFLPVSSSGHLALAQWLLGFDEAPLPFDLVLHMATMGATVLYFWRDIVDLVLEWLGGFVSARGRRSEGWRYGWAVAAGTVVTAFPALGLKPLVERMIHLPWAVGLALVLTASLLFAAGRLPRRGGQVVLSSGFFVGLAQGLAVIPGLSRSGATIVTGLATGLKSEEAFRFSFLLSVPAICGATFLELRSVGSWGDFTAALPSGWLVGAMAAFATGYFSLVLLRRVVTLGRWRGFSLYCLLLGLGTLALSVVRG
ncbi:undecaprenyl-diphosphate phosphatase [Aminirod propionatiphilus]|uniref:Undecaprenyl-diphosphate phosphatase n=1 Tax=Aminirod propionatiphilus TaxID=3415223 RepID=A0ACD1DXQ9_9BACT|nr:undecaprenyl-diphosphate phosphatase [Synergistota bacterium]